MPSDGRQNGRPSWSDLRSFVGEHLAYLHSDDPDALQHIRTNASSIEQSFAQLMSGAPQRALLDVQVRSEYPTEGPRNKVLRVDLRLSFYAPLGQETRWFRTDDAPTREPARINRVGAEWGTNSTTTAGAQPMSYPQQTPTPEPLQHRAVQPANALQSEIVSLKSRVEAVEGLVRRVAASEQRIKEIASGQQSGLSADAAQELVATLRRDLDARARGLEQKHVDAFEDLRRGIEHDVGTMDGDAETLAGTARRKLRDPAGLPDLSQATDLLSILEAAGDLSKATRARARKELISFVLEAGDKLVPPGSALERLDKLNTLLEEHRMEVIAPRRGDPYSASKHHMIGDREDNSVPSGGICEVQQYGIRFFDPSEPDVKAKVIVRNN